MRRVLPDQLLSRLSEFLAERIGLNFPPRRWGDLERGIAAAARELGVPDAESYARRLLSTPLTQNQVEVLASYLTVGETYFFREKRSFEALEEHILPELLRSRRGERRLRIWSAGCCTGEEPYSIAMLLDRLIPDPEEWNVTILATDINPQFLKRAAEGVYGDWSFRDTPAWIRERYFKRTRDGRFELHTHIRKRVTFSYLNLVDDVYPSLSNNTNAMDVIFCRNVLMYFTSERTKQVARNLHRSLVDGGWLIVSPTETSNSLFSPFSAVEFPGAVLYRKTGDVERRTAAMGYPQPLSVPEPDVLYPQVPIVLPEPIVQETVRAIPRKEAPQAQARPPASEAVEVQPGPDDGDALSRNARICADRGSLIEANEWCNKAIAVDKMNPAHHYLLATIQREQGQADAAAQSLVRALYLDPDFVLTHFALGNLRLTQGRRREAERHFANTLALLQKHPPGEVLPESDGLTAGRLTEIVTSVLASQPRAATSA